MPSTISCPYCGKTLEPRIIPILGRDRFLGFEECDCTGAQLERKELANARREQERREREALREWEIETSGIPPRFREAKDAQAARYASTVMDGSNLYIYGNVGTGKTTLAAAVSIAIIDGWNVTLKFANMHDILADIRYTKGYDPTYPYKDAEVLVLDDLGKENTTGFYLEQLFAIVDDRYNHMRQTIVTTQYKPSELIARLAEKGDHDTAQAIVSRLRENCLNVEIAGDDRRLA